MTTVVALSIGLIALALDVAAWVASVKLGTQWAKVPSTWQGIIWLAVLIYSVVTVCVMAGMLSLDHGPNVQLSTLAVTSLVRLGVPLFVIKKAYSSTAMQTLKIWFATILSVGFSMIVALAIRHFLLEAYAAPTNSMAPTIVGQAVLGTCPECGAKTYLPRSHVELRPPPPSYVICENFHTTEVDAKKLPTDVEFTSKDRFLTNKLIRPRRWDLVVFLNPHDPSQKYVKRVVGFPNETLQLKEGSVWIDGTRLIPPPHLEGIQFSSEMPYVTVNGATPVSLGPDEYFVLGDNTMNALDSRLWRSNSPGAHAAYAVPADHLIGVVTHIYWPKDRIRILR